MNTPTPSQPRPNSAGNLIRVDQVAKLPHLNAQERLATQNRVQALWTLMNDTQQPDLRRRQAHQQLTVISQQIMQAMKAYGEQNKAQQMQTQAIQNQALQIQQIQSQQIRQQQANANAALQAQTQTQAQAQPQPQPQVQTMDTATNSNTANTANTTATGSGGTAPLAPEVQQQLDAYQFWLPPAMSAGTPPADDWLKEAKNRLGSALQRMQTAKVQRNNMQRLAVTRQQQQGSLTVAEQNTFNEKMAQFNRLIAEAQTFMEKFKEQQTSFRAARAQPTGNQNQAAAAAQEPQQQQQIKVEGQGIPQQRPLSSIGQHNAPNSSIPAATVQAQPQTQSLPTTPAAVQSSTVQPGQTQPPRLQYPSQAGANALQAPGAPNASQPQVPLNIPQPQAPPPSTISNVQASQPSTNRLGFNASTGHGAARAMAEQPLSAISGYALEQSPDGRVLGKKKLHELINEVLGKDNDGLTPEAEELCIDYVNDFVDELLSHACKLAKLRGSSHLDVKDVQVVLEKRYNMRVPGYSTDELRVARRPPASTAALGWTQRSDKTGAASNSK